MSSWKLVDPQLTLYRYAGSYVTDTGECKPMLMLHGTLASHRSWDVLAENLSAAGINKLYALDMAEVQHGTPIRETFEQVAHAIRVMLDDFHPQADQVVLIGHSAGALVAYRYWQIFEADARVATLFMLAAPHVTTVFHALGAETVQGAPPPKQEVWQTYSLPVDFTKITAVQGQLTTILVNIIGNQVGPDFDAVVRGMRSVTQTGGIIPHAVGPTYDGVMRGLYLPEAVNFVLPFRPPMDHKDINKDARVVDVILSCLKGEYYQVKLKLVAMRLVGEDQDHLSGPVAFEINGVQMPPDSVFQGVTDRLYLFEEHAPPICTLSFPVHDNSGTITLHLKDLSDQQGRRRRMFTRLHIPLREADSTTHTMQDSEGSDFVWRVICQRMPTTLKDPYAPEQPRRFSKGI